MAIPVIGLGAGGHAKVVIEILRLDGRYDLIGLLDPKPGLKGQQVLGVPVLGDDSCLRDLVNNGVRHFFIGLGGGGNTQSRRQLYQVAQAQGMQPVNAVHPTAILSPSATFGKGITIMAHVIVNACAVLGENVILNSGAIVEHDCLIGNHVHIATGARLASTVYVGEGSHIGVGASVRQCIRIGRNVVVGAGAAVVDDLPDEVVAVGVPARILKTREVKWE